MYLNEMKDLIKKGRVRIDINKKRMDNYNLIRKYDVSSDKQIEILMSLEVDDFCEILQNEHKGYEHELLYVFGKEVVLTNRYDENDVAVKLYIKTNLIKEYLLIVISFHEQRYPLKYQFK